MKNKKIYPFFLTIIVILLDQVTKALTVGLIPLYSVGFSSKNGFFRLIHVRNPGVAFSMGDQLPIVLRKILFILFPFVVLGYLVWYLWTSKEESLFQKFCLAGILGGGVGNLIDRVFRPLGVVDFFDVKFYGLFGLERWPTFNIADSAVVICGILLIISLVRKEKK